MPLSAPGGAARFDPFAVDVRLDRVFSEVVDGIVIFLRHHIEVRLQNYRLAVFHTGGRAFTNQNVANWSRSACKPFSFAQPMMCSASCSS